MKIVIKHDKRALIIDIILAVLGTAMYFLPIFFADTIVDALGLDILYIVTLFSMFAGFGLMVYSYVSVPCVIIYLIRLKYYGFEVPKNKKEYDSDLAKLPRREDAGKLPKGATRKYSLQSTVFAIITLLCYLSANAWTIWYTVSWSGYNNAIGGIFFVVDIYWIILLIVFLIQRNNNKYKNDLEFTPNRKNRMTIESSAIGILLLVCFCIFSKSTVQSMTTYIFRSAMAVDQNFTCDIQETIAFEINNISNTDYEQDYQEVYPELKAGVDITNWTVEDNRFKMRILSALDLYEFNELDKKYRTTKGDTEIFVKLEDDNTVIVTAGKIRKQAKKYKGDSLYYEAIGQDNEREVVR